ncbi:MAG: TonB-dependent receptor [Bacteroidales bacterium]|nr:TonB-dependent receptor [Bacteroidales bacterium]MBN2818016.1 TonB-dependent receptor [Bacteroidales bacterium]
MSYKQHLYKVVLTLLFCFLYAFGYAQGINVTGQVTSNGEEALPGVSIVIKGTTTGVITDLDGNYSITVPDANAVLVYSFLGYITEEIQVNGQTTIDIVLDEDLMELDEVVVVGYGIQKKSDLTGSVASLKEDDFNKISSATPEQLIQGRIAGVQITSNNGEPGAGSSIRIRGASTIRSGQSPLYVIDGVPLDNSASSPDGATASGIGGPAASNPLNFLNANDIESIDILKDASAAAIYGSRGANGVILITTKKGKEGVSSVNYAATMSISKLPKKLDVLTAEEWLTYRIDTIGLDAVNENHVGSETDWQDQVFRTAVSQSHNLSFSGGTEKTSYMASFNYSDENGIIKNSNQKRYYSRINFTQKAIKDRLFVEANLTAAQTIQNRPPIGTNGFEGGLLLNALKANPTWPVYDSTGEFYQSESTSERNPVAMLELTEDITRTSRILAGGSATLKIIEGLNYKGNFGIDYTGANRKTMQSQELNYQTMGGQSSINTSEFINYVIEHTLNYNKSIGSSTIGAMAGFSYQKIDKSGYKRSTEGFTTPEIKYYYNPEGGDVNLRISDSWADTYQELQSFFGRVNYNLQEKYLITASFRHDGSSKFGKDVKYGNFPSIAGAWRLSQEDFIKNTGIFNNLKLRVGWGMTGNSEISSDNSTYLLKEDPGSKAIIGNVVIPGFKLDKTPSDSLSWEATRSTNIGLDWGVLGGRLSGTFDIFRKVTTDLLLTKTTKPLSPTDQFVKNLEDGYILNNGLEIGINGVIAATDNFGWDVNFNFTAIHNEAVDILASDEDIIATGSVDGQGLTGSYVQAYANGKSLATFYMYKFDSVNARGQLVYVKNPGGSVDSLMFMGSPLPKFTMGLNNSFRYKNFDFNFFIDVVYGNKIFNNTAILLEKTNLNQAQNALQSWVEDAAGFGFTNRQSDRYLEDGSYLRLSNATIGYNVNVNNIDWIQNCRIYASGYNLLLLTKYTGYDPDVSSSADMNDVKSLGIDLTNYPKARTFLFGVNLTF